jgi:hypothetical protein
MTENRIVKVQAKIPKMMGEAYIVEDKENLWVLEIKPSPIVRTIVDKIRREREADEWQRINPHLRKARKLV